MMPVGKDPSDRHFIISLAKSATRLLGCVLGIAFQSVSILAVSFIVAELLGIYEEL
jgi:hypothetical protein